MANSMSITLQEALLLQAHMHRRSTVAARMAAQVSLVQDAELKTILLQEFDRAQQEIRDLQSLLQTSQIYS